MRWGVFFFFCFVVLLKVILLLLVLDYFCVFSWASSGQIQVVSLFLPLLKRLSLDGNYGEL